MVHWIKRHFTLLTMVISSVLLFPSIIASFIFNYANVTQLHGRIDIRAYVLPVKILPENPSVRWQAAYKLAQAGQTNAVATLLEPFFNNTTFDLTQAKLILATLMNTNRKAEAIAFYQRLDPKPVLPSGIAARILHYYLQSYGDVPSDVTQTLLPQVAGLQTEIPEYQLFKEQFSARQFWKSPLGKTLQQSFTWRCQDQKGETPEYVFYPDITTVLTRTARILQVPVDTIQIGSELIVNGSFELYDVTNDMPQGWNPSFMTTGNPWNRAIFVVGPDTNQATTGVRSLRIDGLYVENNAYLEAARSGVSTSFIRVKSVRPHLISFSYRTENIKEANAAALWVSNESEIFFSNYHSFPPTHGQWKRVTIITWNRSDSDETIAPLLASFSEGSVWFDDFSIRELIIDPPIVPQDAIIQIETQEKQDKDD